MRTLLLAALWLGSLVALPPPPAAAAEGVDVRIAATYAVRPADRVVRVTLDATVRNTTRDVGRRRFFYTGYALALPAEAVKVAATAGTRRLTVTARPQKDHVEARVEFGRRLFRGESLRLRLTFDLRDAGPRSKGTTRVGRAYLAFYVHAYGDARSDVRVEIPPGYVVQTRGSALPERSTGRGGTIVLSAPAVPKPIGWWAWISAQRSEALRVDTVSVPIAGRDRTVEIRAWPEDTRWTAAVRERLTRGLPVLRDLIGVEWPLTAALRVVERHAPLLGGYAGFYDLRAQEIQMSEDLDEHVTLHEVSHAWFNDALFRDRWINEGLADEYASQALRRLGQAGDSPRAVDRSAATAFALNDWDPLRDAGNGEPREAEAYGYDASWGVLRAIVAEVGADAMRAVLVAAAAREIAYLGEDRAERRPAVADWRAFLDLLEQRAGSRQAAALFERWVVDEADRARLAERAVARGEYAALEAAARPWAVPLRVRSAMADWDFTAARAGIRDARVVIERRDRIRELASSLGVTPSPQLQPAYEAPGTDLTPALSLADDELATLEAIQHATRAVGGADLDVVERVGLLGTDPAARVRDARDAASAGDFEGARAAARDAESLVEAAGAVGTERVAVGGAGAGAGVGGALALLLRRRRRRAPRRT